MYYFRHLKYWGGWTRYERLINPSFVDPAELTTCIPYKDTVFLSTLYAPSLPALCLSVCMSGHSYLREAVGIPPGAKPRKGISGKLLIQDDILAQSTIMAAFGAPFLRSNTVDGYTHFDTRPVKDGKHPLEPFYLRIKTQDYYLFAVTHAISTANNASPYGRHVGYGSPSTPRPQTGPSTTQIHASLPGEAHSTFKSYIFL